MIASKLKYVAYPNCLPTAQYFTTGSIDLLSTATAAALKCSTNLPSRSALRVRANCFLMASKGAISLAGLFVR